nr:type 4a pilus biogenesis protein PilO [Acanthopleuribacter pedis]
MFTNFFFLKDVKLGIERAKADIEQLNTDISVAKNIQNTANELQEQMTHLRAQLDRLKKVLPVDINKPKFQADVKRYANENGIEIVGAVSNKPVIDDVIVEHPFAYEAEGSFHDFGRFFAQLTNYPRIVNIKGLSLSKSEEAARGAVAATFVVSVYSYREPTPEELKAQIEAKKAEASGGKNKKRRGRR